MIKVIRVFRDSVGKKVSLYKQAWYPKRIVVLGSVIVLMTQVFVFFGCSEANGRITTPADFTGFITQIKTAEEGKGVTTIFAESHADKIVHRYLIEVTNNTMFFQWDEKSYYPSGINDLLLHDHIQVWFSTPVKKPHPIRGRAKQVVVINHY